MGMGHDAPPDRRLDWTRDRRVFVQGEVCPRPMVVSEVRRQDLSEMPLVQDDEMVETLPAYRADEPFHERILPRAGGSGEHLTDPHAL